MIDGKTYYSVNEMPPDVRARYEKAMRMLKDQDRDGRPDVFDVASSTQAVSNTMKFVVNGREYNSLEDLPPEARAPQATSPTISPDTSNGWMLVLAGGLLLLLCAAGAIGVWYFLLRQESFIL